MSEKNGSLRFDPWGEPYIDEEKLLSRLLTHLGIEDGDKIIIQKADGSTSQVVCTIKYNQIKDIVENRFIEIRKVHEELNIRQPIRNETGFWFRNT